MKEQKSTWGGARPNSGGKRPNAGRKPRTIRINIAEACLLSESISEMALLGKFDKDEMELGLQLSKKLLKFVRAATIK